MTPKYGAPFLIELIERLVTATQPSLEFLHTSGAVTTITELIVNLPTNYCRVTGIMFSHFCYYTLCIFVVKQIIRTVFAAIAKGHAQSIFAYAKQFMRFFHQPRRR